ncbi:glutathione S-transferase family protein [Pseudorhodobacter turbinis]|uniref:Glutathione S-transferase family protein n=1 Tax=Pseudorhodobacter turbinis TaxID=2500533 RepID=A0A4V1E0Q9_9RHOB|nr:glutathione S-transferase family protein [Pseudorhodobacter turbinis]QCO55494.1 glutathione S-transferase family protein [Pseudorhodobacter turbinis]
MTKPYKLYYTTKTFTTESTGLIPRIALEELGLPYEVEEVELSPSPPDWYLGLNRRGQIPTLAVGHNDGPVVHIAPSPAILLALADRHPEGGLLPVIWVERAKCYAALIDMVENLHARFMPLFTPERYSTQDTDAGSTSLASCRSISAYFAEMDQRLSRQSFVVGTGYSLCDIYFYVMVRWYLDISPSDGLTPFESFTNISAYCRRIEARGAVQASLQKDEISKISTHESSEIRTGTEIDFT